MSCGVGHRCGSDPVLLWLWCRLAAPIRPLAWEPPYAGGAALEKAKKKKVTFNDKKGNVKTLFFKFFTIKMVKKKKNYYLEIILIFSDKFTFSNVKSSAFPIK